MKSSFLFLLSLLILVSCNGKKNDEKELEDIGEAIATCNLYGPPTKLTYSQTQVEVFKNMPINLITATYNSALPVTFRSTPGLPEGISISPVTGEVSGTPTVPGDRVYSLIAANQCGAVTFDLRIKVKELPPTALSYPAPSYVIDVGDNFPTITPTVTGATSFSVTPALPAGLMLDPDTGTIFGKPFSAQLPTNYVISASNSGGSVATNLTIMIKGKAPSNLSYQSPSSTYRSGVLAQDNYPLYSGDTATNFSISPSLPLGLSLNPSTGVVGGI